MLCFANNITISQAVIFHYTLWPIKYQNYEETSSVVDLIGSKDKEIPCIGQLKNHKKSGELQWVIPDRKVNPQHPPIKDSK